MLLLLLFALIAGAGTAITPCVLPIIPALLSTAATGGRRRPLGIVLGLAIAFTVAITAAASIVHGVGGGSTALRDAAVVVLIGFGLVMLVPAVAQRIQAPLSRLARFGPRTRGDGFLSGIGVGAALGFVCAPCAGPILAAVIAASARSAGPTADTVLVGLCFSAGLAGMMLLYGLGGRAVLSRVRRAASGHRVERGLGVVLILTGVAMAFNLDSRLDSFIARHQNDLPGFLFDPTQSLEKSHTVSHELARLRGTSPFVSAAATATTPQSAAVPASVGIPGVRTPALKDLGRAPNFTDTQDWFNTPGDRPLSITGLRGKVVLVDFWTYTCINCIRTLPFIEGLYQRYRADGLVVVGVETPEFTFEQDAANVAQAIRSDHLTYPVVQDNDYGTWNAYGNEYWPADYLIDASGEVRHTQFGEGDYRQEEAAVRTLLYEAGAHHLPPPTTAQAIIPSSALGSGETYLNPARDGDPQAGVSFAQAIRTGTHAYTPPSGSPEPNQWALSGSWTGVNPASQTYEGYITPAAGGASIIGGVEAENVYLVMTSDGGTPRPVKVLLNGRPVPASEAGADLHDSTVTVRGDRLYHLLSLPRDAIFTLKVEVPPGVDAYDFTFG